MQTCIHIYKLSILDDPDLLNDRKEEYESCSLTLKGLQKLREEADAEVSLDDEVHTDEDSEDPKGNSSDGHRQSKRLKQIKSSQAVTQSSQQPKVTSKKSTVTGRQSASTNKKLAMEKAALEQIKQDRLTNVIVLNFNYKKIKNYTNIFHFKAE